MNVFLLKAILLLSLVITYSEKSSAYLTSSFDVNAGQSSFIAKTHEDLRTIDSFSTLEMNYSLRNSSLGLAYAISFFELINSKEGMLAFTRLSVGPRWYPIGMNGNKLLIDNDVVAKIWKATPFIGMSLGMSNISTSKYNASLLDLGIRAGVEIPITPNFLINFQYNLSQSMGGASKSAQSAISYTGNSATLGLLISGVGE